MPRIRSLKPQFWDSPDTAGADLAVRLLYMAMWNWADDSGRGTANLKELEAFAFPNDDVGNLPRKPTCGDSATVWRNFRDIVAGVQESFGVVFYRVRGRGYYWIPSFKAHQSKNFNENSQLPAPEDGVIWDLTCDDDEICASSSGNSAPDRGDSPTESREVAEIYPLDRDRDRDKDSCATSSRDPASPEPTTRRPAADRFEEFWKVYPVRRDRRKAERAFAAATKRASVEEIVEGARRYSEDPNRVQKFTKYAEGWLNGDGWKDDPLPSRNNGYPLNRDPNSGLLVER